MSHLYLDHFGLSKTPFQITPDLDYFFSGSRRGDLLTALLHVALHEEGIVTVVAEVGSGKTLLARLMLSRLPSDVCTVYLANPCFSRAEIISAIARDLGLAALPDTLEGKIAALQQELLRCHANGRRVLLVIDEAHAMPADSLEEVRLLSNLETAQNKLLNIMLFGQPELDALLAEPRLRQLRDRVIHRFDLLPFSREDGIAYIDHRLRIAGWQGGKLLTPAAEKFLVRAAGGRARRINLLADKALLAVYSEGLRRVDKRHVQRACIELHTDPVSAVKVARETTLFTTSFPWFHVLGISLPLALILVGAILWLSGWSPPGFSLLDGRFSNTAVLAPVTASATPVASMVPALTAPAIEVADKSQEVVQAQSSSVPGAVAGAPAVLVSQADSQEGYLRRPMADGGMREVFDRTNELLANPGANGFTLQIATLKASEDLSDYFRIVSRSVDSKLLFAHNVEAKGGRHVAFYIGQYATREAAQVALEHLPAPLKANQPLMRTWAKIRQEAVPQP